MPLVAILTNQTKPLAHFLVFIRMGIGLDGRNEIPDVVQLLLCWCRDNPRDFLLELVEETLHISDKVRKSVPTKDYIPILTFRGISNVAVRYEGGQSGD